MTDASRPLDPAADTEAMPVAGPAPTAAAPGPDGLRGPEDALRPDDEGRRSDAFALVASRPSELPTGPAPYHHFLRTPRARWWKGLLLILSFVAIYLGLSIVLTIGAVSVDVAMGRVNSQDLLEGRLTMTPALLLATNLAPALMIPGSLLLQWAFFGQRPRWMHSVQGAFRWRLLLRAAVVIVPLWAAYVLLTTFVLAPPPTGRFTTESVVLLVIVVLTTPLQAAGEEYGARGLLTRAAGSWVADPRLALVLGTLVSAVLFTVAHGAGDPWLITYYFVFAVSLSVVTWRTGGLEVAVLVHAVNNVFLFVLLVSLGSDLSQTFNRQDGVAGPSMLVPMALLVLVAAVVWFWARRLDVVRTFTPPAPVSQSAPLENALRP